MQSMASNKMHTICEHFWRDNSVLLYGCFIFMDLILLISVASKYRCMLMSWQIIVDFVVLYMNSTFYKGSYCIRGVVKTVAVKCLPVAYMNFRHEFFLGLRGVFLSSIGVIIDLDSAFYSSWKYCELYSPPSAAWASSNGLRHLLAVFLGVLYSSVFALFGS